MECLAMVVFYGVVMEWRVLTIMVAFIVHSQKVTKNFGYRSHFDRYLLEVSFTLWHVFVYYYIYAVICILTSLSQCHISVHLKVKYLNNILKVLERVS